MACLWKRGKVYYARYYVGGRQRAVSLDTRSYRIARERLRELESSLALDFDTPLPTRTPIAEVVAAYIAHIQSTKTKSSLKNDLYYLRDIFGPIIPALFPADQRSQECAHKGRRQNRTRANSHLEANYFEHITTKQIASFISNRMRSRGLAPKTCNHYRGVLSRLFNWATGQYGVRMPQDTNPAQKVERYREKAHRIRFLTLQQIDEQLDVLKENLLLQTMVAVYIYAGLRREELLWLTDSDVDLHAGRFGAIYVQSKTVNGERWEPKTKTNRVVPVSSALRCYLDRYQSSHVEGVWYFPSPTGKRWDPDNFSQLLREVNREAGLSWSCLDFRHTFGSQLAMKGESLYKISTLMGNSPEICRRHYATLMPDSLIDSVEFGPMRSEARARPNLRLIVG